MLWGRLKRRPSEKLFPKRYASCFKGTSLEQMLSTLGVDTVIVVGAIAPEVVDVGLVMVNGMAAVSYGCVVALHMKGSGDTFADMDRVC